MFFTVETKRIHIEDERNVPLKISLDMVDWLPNTIISVLPGSEQLGKLASQHIELLSNVEKFEYLLVVSKAMNIKIEIMHCIKYKEI